MNMYINVYGICRAKFVHCRAGEQFELMFWQILFDYSAKLLGSVHVLFLKSK